MSPARECPNCGDPLPLDGHCDCRGDLDRDYRTAYRDLGVHEMPVRHVTPTTTLGPKTRRGDFDSVVRGSEIGGSDNLPDLWV